MYGSLRRRYEKSLGLPCPTPSAVTPHAAGSGQSFRDTGRGVHVGHRCGEPGRRTEVGTAFTMSDRFDFLEIGEQRPPRAPASAPTPTLPQPPGYAGGPVLRPVEEPAPAPGWRVVEVIGGPGSAFGQFQSPGGLAVDIAGNLYVADSYNHRVQRI